jgi:Flp pilus assembly protein protease CpaA
VIKASVLFISALVCAIDIRVHRIPNKLSLALVLPLLFDATSTELPSFLIALPLTLLISSLGKIGAGDVKLFLLLAATSGSAIFNQSYLLGMALVSLFTIAFTFAFSRVKGVATPQSIAFAPSILIPFNVLYLAI